MNKSVYTRKARAMGAKLRLAIQQSSFSQREIGDILGVNKNTIQNWLNGRHSPDAVLLQEIAKLTERPIEFFYMNKDPIVERLDELKALVVKYGRQK